MIDDGQMYELQIISTRNGLCYYETITFVFIRWRLGKSFVLSQNEGDESFVTRR